ncbi:MAG TPA: DUF2780 domain-containing protein [Polyangia bacterium]|jgi:hypothetical protein|nr:DUF2780 domain-containing protein [Polyangia bacterium]
MDIIATVTEKLGIPTSAAEGAVGSLLGVIKQAAPPEAAAAIEQKVPEAAQWAASAPEGGEGGEGGSDALGGLVGGLLGGTSAGPLAALTGQLSKLGIGADSIGQLVPLVLQFLKGRVGDGVVAKIMGALPMLGQLGGGEGGGGSPLGALGGLFK